MNKLVTPTATGESVVTPPKRDHYLKWQCSLPAGSKNMRLRMEAAFQAAAEHHRALIGSLGHDIHHVAVFQERGKGTLMFKYDCMLVTGWNGPLNDHTKKLKIERNVFETDKAFDAMKAAKA